MTMPNGNPDETPDDFSHLNPYLRTALINVLTAANIFESELNSIRSARERECGPDDTHDALQMAISAMRGVSSDVAKKLQEEAPKWGERSQKSAGAHCTEPREIFVGGPFDGYSDPDGQTYPELKVQGFNAGIGRMAVYVERERNDTERRFVFDGMVDEDVFMAEEYEHPTGS